VVGELVEREQLVGQLVVGELVEREQLVGELVVGAELGG
jgi:hypothetical protein